MKIAVVLLFATLSLACLFERDSNLKRGAHWAYGGEAGPDHWADLDSAYATCGSGKKQTPIELVESEAVDYPVGIGDELTRE
jgi:carbonic anhydrase